MQPVELVHYLDVWLDSELTMKQHFTEVANACFHHLRRRRRIRPGVVQDVADRLVVALVISWLDFCSSMSDWLPGCTIDPLQRHAASLVF
jgi:hypothetical protein